MTRTGLIIFAICALVVFSAIALSSNSLQTDSPNKPTTKTSSTTPAADPQAIKPGHHQTSQAKSLEEAANDSHAAAEPSESEDLNPSSDLFQHGAPALAAPQAQLLIDPNQSDTNRHKAAEALRVDESDELLTALLYVLVNEAEQPRFRSWAVQHLYNVHPHLARHEQQLVEEQLTFLLTDADAPVRSEALFSLHRLDKPIEQDVLKNFLVDDETAHIAIRIIRRSKLKAYVPEIRELVHSQSVDLQIAAVVTLAEWHDIESRPAIAQLAQLPKKNETYRLQRAAEMALARLDKDETD